MLELITGRTGSGKTTLIHRQILERISKNSADHLILLVPEQYTLQAERELLTWNRLAGILKIEVLSFQRLAYKVLNEVGGRTHSDINDLGKVMVLRRIFNSSREELQVYGRAAGKDGFLKEFNHLLTEFKKNQLSPAEIEKQSVQLESEQLLQNKLQDIALIYDRYNQFMEGRYEDQEDRFELFIEHIPQSTYLAGAVIWLDGFHGFTVQEYRIIEQLLLKADRVAATLTLDRVGDSERAPETGDVLFNPTMKTYRRLEKLALLNGEEVEKTRLERVNHKPAELQHLEKQLFAYPFEKFPGRGFNSAEQEGESKAEPEAAGKKEEGEEKLTLFAGSNYYSEVEHAASRMVTLARERGHRWREMALITGDISRYALHIKRVFSEYGIPFFLDEKKGIMNNPTVRCLLSGFRITYRNFRYEDVFNYLKSGFSTLYRREYEELENFALEYGIEGGKWSADFEIETEGYDLPEINQLRERFLSPLLRLKGGMEKAAEVREYNSCLFSFLQEINLEEKLTDWIAELREEGRLAAVRENTQIWNIILEVLEQLDEIMGRERLSAEEYYQVLEAGLREYELAIIPPTVDQVFVGNLERSRSHRIKDLFILGINDGVLPRSGVRDGILLDDEKLLLKERGLEINSDSITGIEEERFRIYTAAAKPEEYLWLSHSLADMEGSSLRPSILFKRVEEIFPGIETQSELQEEGDTSMVSTPEATFKYLVEKMRDYLEGQSVPEGWWDVYAWYYNHPGWQKGLRGIIEGLFYNNQQDYLSGGRARRLYQQPLKTSISRLEVFSRCPFAHFIDYGLRPEERRIYQLSPLDMGQIFHKAVESFARKLRERGLSWEELDGRKREEIIREAVEEIAPVYGNNILASSCRNRYLLNKIERIGLRATWALTEHLKRGSFLPGFFELGFAEKERIPPLEIPLKSGGKLVLEGRIDRVDLLPTERGLFLKVIDYKTGKKSFSLDEAYHGIELQLLVYLAALLKGGRELLKQELPPALRKELALPVYQVDEGGAESGISRVAEAAFKIEPGGMLYFRIDDPLIDREKISGELEGEILKQLRLDGLVLNDPGIIRAFDNQLEQGYSRIVPVNLKKNGEAARNSAVISREELHSLIKHILERTASAGEEIIKGRVRIEPFRLNKSRTACDYCEYRDICQFDTSINENGYRELEKLSRTEVIKRLQQRGYENEVD